jgi:hypothetical protein
LRRIVQVLVGSLVLCSTALPAFAAGDSTHSSQNANWDRRDAAIYVVSTINLLHTKDGRPVSSLLTDKYGIAHFEVYSDLNAPDLYFIQLRREGGGLAGALAYQMGWQMPASISSLTNRLGVHDASRKYRQAYKSDPKQLQGSFTSTLPQ